MVDLSVVSVNPDPKIMNDDFLALPKLPVDEVSSALFACVTGSNIPDLLLGRGVKRGRRGVLEAFQLGYVARVTVCFLQDHRGPRF